VVKRILLASLLVIAITVATGGSVRAAVICVPDDYPTGHEATDVAVSGDTVVADDT